jgi:hypothetical protein
MRVGAWVVVAMGLAACTSAPSAPAGSACDRYDALAVASDERTSSAVGAFSLDGTGAMTPGVDLGTDPILAISSGRSFLVARDDDAAFVLDPRCGAPLSTFGLHDVGSPAKPSNPHDLAVAADGRMFVSYYNAASVVVWGAGATALARIDLSAYDPDGNPNADALRIVSVGGQEKAFLALARLDDTQQPFPTPTRPSWILRIDVATTTVEGHVELVGRNPFQIDDEGTTLYLAEPGSFYAIGEPNAGIEVFDATTSASNMLASEADLGGSVADVAVDATKTCGAAILYDATYPANRTALVTFDPQSGKVLSGWSQPIFGPTTEADGLEALAWKGDVLMMGDRRSTPRGYPVHVFDRTGSCELLQRPDTVFLPQKPVALGETR